MHRPIESIPLIGAKTEHPIETTNSCQLCESTLILRIRVFDILVTNPIVPRHNRVTSIWNAFGDTESLLRGKVRHMVDVDDHSKPHHLFDGYSAKRRQSFRVAVASSTIWRLRRILVGADPQSCMPDSRRKPPFSIKKTLHLKTNLFTGQCTCNGPEIAHPWTLCDCQMRWIHRLTIGCPIEVRIIEPCATKCVVGDMNRKNVPDACIIETLKLHQYHHRL